MTNEGNGFMPPTRQRPRRRSRRRPALLLLAGVVCSLLMLQVTRAAPVKVGYRDFSYGTGVEEPTSDKPQSKLWWHDGRWWGTLFNPSAGVFRIYWLDLATHAWIDTGTSVGTKNRGDALWDGQKLYIVTGGTSTADGVLRRFSYDPAQKKYSIDSGFPATVRSGGAETITLAKDSTGQLWVTYPQNNQIWVNRSVGSDTQWGTPFVVPVKGANVDPDDLSAVIAFQGNKVGVMWSNQLDKKMYFAEHLDSDPDDVWQASQVALPGPGQDVTNPWGDDHINLKQLNADGSGRVFAAVKTSLNDLPNPNPNAPLVMLLVRDQAGTWTNHVFGRVQDDHTRPMMLVDEEHGQLYMFATAPISPGGTIYYKSTPLSNIAFASGVGTPFIQSDTDTTINNATSTKQNVNSTTGLLVLASDNTSRYYLHNYLSLGSAPAVSLSPTSLAFGDQQVSTTSGAQTVSLTNSGNAPLSISSISLAGNNPGDFSQTHTCPASLAAGAKCTISVSFTPTATGSRSAALTIADNVADSPQTVPLSGTGVGQSLTFTPVADTYVNSSLPSTNFGTATDLGVDASPTQEAYLKFDVTGVGSSVTSARLRLYVINPGPSAGTAARMSNTSWSEASVTYNTRPAIDGPTLSTLGAVSTGQWVDYDVSAAVTGNGTWSFGLRSDATDGVDYASREDSAHTPQLVVSFRSAPAVSLSPTSLAFGERLVGSTSTAQTVTLTNSGSASLIINSISLTGANPGDFAQTNTCGTSVAAGARCTINVTFTPAAAGSRSATLTMNDNAADSPQSVPLSGTGTTAVAPAVSLSPTSVSFAEQQVSSTSTAQAVSLTNSGTASLSISSISVTGTHAGDFAQSHTCPASLAAGAKCSISVSFTPTAAGSRSAALTIADNAADSPQTVPLSGTGTTASVPAVSLSPTSLAFGEQAVGSTSTAQTVTLTNSGQAPLSISTVSLTGTHPSDFSTSSDSCTGATVAPGGTCSAAVRFAPTAAGSRSASLTFTDDAADSPQRVPLSGTATGSVLTFTPIADAHVDSKFTNRNFGTATALKVEQVASSAQEAYLKFELSGLSGTVASAKLRVYVKNPSASGGSVAKMSDTNWSETGVTYDTRPAAAGDGPLLATIGAVSSGQWVEFDVTAAVTGNGTVSFRLKSTDSDAVHYASREDSAAKPQLVITLRP